MTRDSQEITVHVARFVHQRGPVFCASMPCATETFNGCGTNEAGDKYRLVSFLLDRLVAMEGPLWKYCHSTNGAAFPIQVVRDPLGRPHLLLGEDRGPAISFSEGGGKVWAALSGDESDIGIDVAGTDEFNRKYPFHRVFHVQELQHALRLADGNLEKASAMLWSIKEAVVKALGCAFHLVYPRQIYIYPSIGDDGGYTFPVGLSGNALVRFPIAAGRSLWVLSLPQKKMWLSIALLDRRPTYHG
ncbi:MAG: 4'-phosphopantetheinyl transferase superfamily protein [Thermodesulfobacteriota bacterium]|nr:MAG: 4'-phosphopantetheinyl transferase superfamily protein [Thermodesulfobacteriota bacterium]